MDHGGLDWLRFANEHVNLRSQDNTIQIKLVLKPSPTPYGDNDIRGRQGAREGKIGS